MNSSELCVERHLHCLLGKPDRWCLCCSSIFLCILFFWRTTKCAALQDGAICLQNSFFYQNWFQYLTQLPTTIVKFGLYFHILLHIFFFDKNFEIAEVDGASCFCLVQSRAKVCIYQQVASLWGWQIQRLWWMLSPRSSEGMRTRPFVLLQRIVASCWQQCLSRHLPAILGMAFWTWLAPAIF